MDISIVVPVYGCPSAISELHRRLTKTLNIMNIDYEIILVDDCDGMGSWDEIKKVAEEDNKVKAIRLTRNYGQGRAITAGVTAAIGDWIITMDCDLQDAPENIPDLYRKAIDGQNDVVFVRRTCRKESFVVKAFAKLYHKLVSYLSEVPFDYDLATYLIASRRAASYFVSSKDRGRDFGMFLMWLGYKHDFIEFEQENRFAGESSYTFAKKFNYALGIMTTFSNRILYIPIHIGAVASLGSVIYVIIILVFYFIFDANPEGWSTLAAAVFFFGGLILSTLGVLGIYLGNIFDMDKDRPLYVIQETINCNE